MGKINEEFPPDVENEVVEETREWFEIMNDDFEVKKAYLYDGKTGKQKTRFVGEIPDPHDIGVKYGSGEFKMMIQYNDSEGKHQTTTKRFSLAEDYDSIKSESQNEPSPQLSGNTDIASQVSAGITSAFSGILGAVAPVVSPLLPALIDMIKPKPISQAMEEMQMAQIRINEANTKQNNKVYNDSLKTALETVNANFLINQSEEYEEEEGEEESPMQKIVMQLKPILSMAMPTLMNGVTPEMVSMVKNNPLYQQLINNEIAIKEIEDWVYSKFGIDAVNILKSIIES